MLYNLSLIESMSKHDVAFSKTLIGLFIDSIPKDVEALNKAFEIKDWKQVAFISHKLKSTIMTLCIDSLYETIAVLEKEDVKDNFPQSTINSHIEQITTVMNAVVIQLKASL